MRERGEGGDQDTTGTFGERLRTSAASRMKESLERVSGGRRGGGGCEETVENCCNDGRQGHGRERINHMNGTASMRRGGWRGRGWRWHVAVAQLQLGGVKEEHGDGVETQLRQRVRKRSNVGAK